MELEKAIYAHKWANYQVKVTDVYFGWVRYDRIWPDGDTSAHAAPDYNFVQRFKLA